MSNSSIDERAFVKIGYLTKVEWTNAEVLEFEDILRDWLIGVGRLVI